ncbi:hypothetical protein HNR46_004123 [Haloferula luteola]|uniref:Uncharacterized protein n=1 Tax=Haloferula luteola TaxID=595692 RepID=A0A840VJ93_9BACT|nr:hypothetical protein [Haloferula luteola]MBB5353859.1 hypothetical protein [Haloferula luteola]
MTSKVVQAFRKILGTLRWLGIVSVFLFESIRAQPPAGYYETAHGLTGSDLMAALHQIIDDHTSIPYGSTDEVMRVIDEDQQNPNNLELIYSDFSMDKQLIGSSGSNAWNREHLWPRSARAEWTTPIFTIFGLPTRP